MDTKAQQSIGPTPTKASYGNTILGPRSCTLKLLKGSSKNPQLYLRGSQVWRHQSNLGGCLGRRRASPSPGGRHRCGASAQGVRPRRVQEAKRVRLAPKRADNRSRQEPLSALDGWITAVERQRFLIFVAEFLAGSGSWA